MIDFIIARIKEKGTRSVIIGAVVFLAARLGLELDPASQVHLDGLIVAVTAFAVSFLKEKTDVDAK